MIFAVVFQEIERGVVVVVAFQVVEWEVVLVAALVEVLLKGIEGKVTVVIAAAIGTVTFRNTNS